MKIKTMIILSAVMAAAFSGCEKIGDTPQNTAENGASVSYEAVEETTAPEESGVEESKPKTTYKKIYITEPAVRPGRVTETRPADESSDTDSGSDYEDDGDNNQGGGSSDGASSGGNGGGSGNSAHDAAGSLYINAVSMYQDVLLNCPYSLDYDDTDSNGFAAISDPNVDSVDDIASLYCTVFSRPDSYIYERYSESDGKVYCNDGSRGTNIYYSGTELEYVSGDESAMTFNAVSHYKDPDTGEAVSDKTSTFSIVMTDDGYRVSEFSYPK